MAEIGQFWVNCSLKGTDSGSCNPGLSPLVLCAAGIQLAAVFPKQVHIDMTEIDPSWVMSEDLQLVTAQAINNIVPEIVPGLSHCMASGACSKLAELVRKVTLTQSSLRGVFVRTSCVRGLRCSCVTTRHLRTHL